MENVEGGGEAISAELLQSIQSAVESSGVVGQVQLVQAEDGSMTVIIVPDGAEGEVQNPPAASAGLDNLAQIASGELASGEQYQYQYVDEAGNFVDQPVDGSEHHVVTMAQVVDSSGSATVDNTATYTSVAGVHGEQLVQTVTQVGGVDSDTYYMTETGEIVKIESSVLPESEVPQQTVQNAGSVAEALQPELTANVSTSVVQNDMTSNNFEYTAVKVAGIEEDANNSIVTPEVDPASNVETIHRVEEGKMAEIDPRLVTGETIFVSEEEGKVPVAEVAELDSRLVTGETIFVSSESVDSSRLLLSGATNMTTSIVPQVQMSTLLPQVPVIQQPLQTVIRNDARQLLSLSKSLNSPSELQYTHKIVDQNTKKPVQSAATVLGSEIFQKTVGNQTVLYPSIPERKQKTVAFPNVNKNLPSVSPMTKNTSATSTYTQSMLKPQTLGNVRQSQAKTLLNTGASKQVRSTSLLESHLAGQNKQGSHRNSEIVLVNDRGEEVQVLKLPGKHQYDKHIIPASTLMTKPGVAKYKKPAIIKQPHQQVAIKQPVPSAVVEPRTLTVDEAADLLSSAMQEADMDINDSPVVPQVTNEGDSQDLADEALTEIDQLLGDPMETEDDGVKVDRVVVSSERAIPSDSHNAQPGVEPGSIVVSKETMASGVQTPASTAVAATSNKAQTTQSTTSGTNQGNGSPQMKSIDVPDSDVTIQLYADGTLVTKDRGGTNYSRVKLEDLGLDQDMLAGNTDIELLIVQGDGKEVRATLNTNILDGQNKVSVTKIGTVTPTASPAKDVKSSDASTTTVSAGSGTELRPYKCSMCPRTFKFYRTFRCHEIVHTKSEIFTCNLCKRVFARETNLASHLELHQKKANIDQGQPAKNKVKKPAPVQKTLTKMKCAFCDSVFEKYDEWWEHIKTAHESTVPFICKFCDKTFSSKSLLQRHVLVHDGPFSCCGKIYKERPEYVTHLEDSHPSQLYHCTCSKVLISKSDFTSHVKHVHGGDTVEARAQLLEQVYDDFCKICGKRMMKQQLKWHMKDIHGDNTISCPYCNFVCNMDHKLGNHLKEKHDQEHVEKCEHCSEEFASENSLLEHVKFEHMGPYSCYVCSTNNFDRRTEMEKHMFDDHQKGFTCKKCEEKFTYSHELKKHFMEHNDSQKEFLCEDCGDTFEMKPQLKSHIVKEHFQGNLQQMVKVHPDMKHVPVANICQLCGEYDFQTRVEFIKHVRDIHFSGSFDKACKALTVMRKFPNPADVVRCDTCNKTFLTTGGLKLHMKIHVGNTSTSSKKPTKRRDSFDSPASEDEDDDPDFTVIEPRDSDKQYKCGKCKASFARKAALVKHLTSHNKKDEVKEAIKQMEREDEERMKKQLEDIEKDKQGAQEEENMDVDNDGVLADEEGEITTAAQQSPAKNFTCSKCSNSYTTKKSLRKHERDKHRPPATEEEGNKVEEGKQVEEGNEVAYSCQKCEQKYASKVLLQRHAREKHGIAKMEVEAIQSPIMSPTSGKRVVTTYTCSKCPQMFTSKKAIQKHEREKHRPAPPPGCIDDPSMYNLNRRMCIPCARTFDCFPNMNRHMTAKHRVDIPQERAPEFNTSLKKAKKSMESSKSAKSKSSTEDDYRSSDFDSSNLDTSQDITSFLGRNFNLEKKTQTLCNIESVKKKVHKCSQCGTGFSREAALKKHVALHEMEEDMQDIKSEVDDDSSLDVPETVYNCDKCGNMYATSSGLLYHTKIKHTDIKEEDVLNRIAEIDKTLAPVAAPSPRKTRSGVSSTTTASRGTKRKLSMTGDEFHVQAKKREKLDKDGRRSFECMYCDVVYKTFSGVITHEKEYHPSKTKLTPDKAADGLGNTAQPGERKYSHSGRKITKSVKRTEQLQCSICFKYFDLQESLNRHMTMAHTVKRGAGSNKPVKVEKDGAEEDNAGYDYHCSMCDKVYDDVLNLSRHMLMKHKRRLNDPEKVRRGGGDSRSVSSSSDKNAHVKTYHGEDKVKSRTCGVCNKMFPNDKMIEEHMKSHLETKKMEFDCNICGKEFPKELRLKLHVAAVHKTKYRPAESNTGKLSCNICNDHFPNTAKLLNHMLTHTSVMPYKCTICGQCFKHEHVMKEHNCKAISSVVDKPPSTKATHSGKPSSTKATHSKNKPTAGKFACKQCSKKFLTIHALNGHKAHHAAANFKRQMCMSRTRAAQITMMRTRRQSSSDSSATTRSSGSKDKPPNSVHAKSSSSASNKSTPKGAAISKTTSASSQKPIFKHIRPPKTAPSKLPVSCPICSKVLGKKHTLLYHIMKIHNVDAGIIPLGMKGPLKGRHCKKCAKIYWTQADYDDHIKRKHSQKKGTDNSNLEDAVKIEVASPPREVASKTRDLPDKDAFEFETIQHKCEFCGMIFWTKTSFDEHIIKFHPNHIEEYGIDPELIQKSKAAIEYAYSDDEKLMSPAVVMIEKITEKVVLANSPSKNKTAGSSKQNQQQGSYEGEDAMDIGEAMDTRGVVDIQVEDELNEDTMKGMVGEDKDENKGLVGENNDEEKGLEGADNDENKGLIGYNNDENKELVSMDNDESKQNTEDDEDKIHGQDKHSEGAEQGDLLVIQKRDMDIEMEDDGSTNVNNELSGIEAESEMLKDAEMGEIADTTTGATDAESGEQVTMETSETHESLLTDQTDTTTAGTSELVCEANSLEQSIEKESEPIGTEATDDVTAETYSEQVIEDVSHEQSIEKESELLGFEETGDATVETSSEQVTEYISREHSSDGRTEATEHIDEQLVDMQSSQVENIVDTSSFENEVDSEDIENEQLVDTQNSAMENIAIPDSVENRLSEDDILEFDLATPTVGSSGIEVEPQIESVESEFDNADRAQEKACDNDFIPESMDTIPSEQLNAIDDDAMPVDAVEKQDNEVEQLPVEIVEKTGVHTENSLDLSPIASADNPEPSPINGAENQDVGINKDIRLSLVNQAYDFDDTESVSKENNEECDEMSNEGHVEPQTDANFAENLTDNVPTGQMSGQFVGVDHNDITIDDAVLANARDSILNDAINDTTNHYTAAVNGNDDIGDDEGKLNLTHPVDNNIVGKSDVHPIGDHIVEGKTVSEAVANVDNVIEETS